MNQDGKLSQQQHEAIFRDKILPRSGFADATAQASPRAIILAGQPGAGKGSVQVRSLNDLGGNAVAVDPDELRDFHPQVRLFRSAHPYTWGDDTHPDASAWARELRDEVIRSRKHVVVDTVLSGERSAIELIGQLREAGYDVEIRAVATHFLESENGVDHRFCASMDTRGFGRYVPCDVRRAAYENIPLNLDSVQAATGVPIRIYEREGDLAWDSSTDTGRPGEALARIRENRVISPTRTNAILCGWTRQVEWHASLGERLTTEARLSTATRFNLLAERTRLGVVEAVTTSYAEAGLLHDHVMVQQKAFPAPGRASSQDPAAPLMALDGTSEAVLDMRALTQERVDRMLVAARNDDWQAVRQDTQVLAGTATAQALKQQAAQRADAIEQEPPAPCIAPHEQQPGGPSLDREQHRTDRDSH